MNMTSDLSSAFLKELKRGNHLGNAFPDNRGELHVPGEFPGNSPGICNEEQNKALLLLNPSLVDSLACVVIMATK